MRYHQLRVAALSNALHRAPRAADNTGLHAWHLWATRGENEGAWEEVRRIKYARRNPPAVFAPQPKSIGGRLFDVASFSAACDFLGI